MPEDLAVRGYRYVRHRAGDWVAEVGRLTMLLGDVGRFLAPGLRSFGLVVDQMKAIGVGSLWLVVVVSLFTGGVAAVQAAYQFSSVVPLKYSDRSKTPIEPSASSRVRTTFSSR